MVVLWVKEFLFFAVKGLQVLRNKLLAISSSESYLFEPLKKDNRGRSERKLWGELEHNVFMAVVPEVLLIPKSGVPLRWLEIELPKNGSIYRPTLWRLDEND